MQKNNTPLQEDQTPWYTIRLARADQEPVRQALEALHLECFIPMEYVETDTSGQPPRLIMRPVVHNLLFLKKTMPEREIRNLLAQLPHRIFVIRKDDRRSEYYEIPPRQMEEFQLMCNPAMLMRKFLSNNEARLKSGTPVVVQHGPLKGLTGKLVRSNKKYFLLKEVPGLGIMLKISRWCCKPLNLPK